MGDSVKSHEDTLTPSSTAPSRVSNINAGDLDKKLAQTLRGDAIGDTMYSESFVAKTLLRLVDVEWTVSLEEDLCFLWDMTLEHDVCEYLVKLSLASIVCEVINTTEENRLIEIMVGILANVSCMTESSCVTESQIEIILSIITSNDPLILIQIVRFLKVITTNRPIYSFISVSTMGQLHFILLNSCNKELLLATLDAVSSLVEDQKLDVQLLKGDLLKSTLIAYQCLLSNTDQSDEEGIENKGSKAFAHLIKIAYNICCYINEQSDQRLLNEIIPHINIFLDEIARKFHKYEVEEYLLNGTKELHFYADTLMYIFQVLHVNYHKELFQILVMILKYHCVQIIPCFELLLYFMSVGKMDNLNIDIKNVPKKIAKCVLERISTIIEKISIPKETYQDNLNALLTELK